jgi:lipid II isoglutaminyl synthase (glutamine-hydrolysing)
VTVSSRPDSALSGRASAAVEALRFSNWLSRALGRGSGTVAGGRVGLAIDPGLLGQLAAGRQVALVTGTNGKTTTTRLLVAALGVGEDHSVTPVASNTTGANMPAGHVSALAERPGAPAVLEVDESYLGRLIDETHARVVLLLNLSRDQLDRISEVRMMVERWRQALTGSSGTIVVANADDPMVVWSARAAPEVRWVGAGQVWHDDAVGCPACGGGIEFATDGDWACDRCDFRRPRRHAWLEGDDLVLDDGRRHRIELRIPGRFNRANAAMAAMAAPWMAGEDGVADPVADALVRMATVGEVAGRFGSITRGGRNLRLLLAKNPAGWTAVFDLLEESGAAASPLVLSINARTADGLDTSWLWDVPFERLQGRSVIATGDRRLDLGVRLRYAEVDHEIVDDPVEAVDRASMDAGRVLAAPSGAEVGGRRGRRGASANGDSANVDSASNGALDVIANYTAFADLRKRL